MKNSHKHWSRGEIQWLAAWVAAIALTILLAFFIFSTPVLAAQERSSCDQFLHDHSQAALGAHPDLTRVRLAGGGQMFRADQANGAVVELGGVNTVAVEVLGDIFAAVILGYQVDEISPQGVGGFTATSAGRTLFARVASGVNTEVDPPVYGRLVVWFQCIGG